MFAIFRQHFPINFLDENCWILIQISLKICFQGSSWQQGSFDSDNGLMPNRQQTIIWANAGLIYWWIHTLFGPDEFRWNI